MQTFLDVALALKGLGLSFWQLTLVGLIIFFRQDLRNLLNRLKSVEGLGGKLILQENVARQLESIAAQSNASAEMIRDDLHSLLRRQYLNALIHIRTQTRVLWPELTRLPAGQAALLVDILHDVYQEIEPSLKLLKAAGLFDFVFLPQPSRGNVAKLSLTDIKPELMAMVSEVAKQEFKTSF